MDEAFIPVGGLIVRALDFRAEIVDESEGVRTRIYECRIEMPVELSVTRDEDGALRVGSTPPLYYVETTFRPSFHQIQVTARLVEDADADAEHLLGA